MVLGLLATMALDQLWLYSWSKSGQTFPVGSQHTITLPVGRSLVYYESAISVPSGPVTLQLYDPAGTRSRVPPPRSPQDSKSYRILLTGVSGRAFWELDILEAGDYRVIASNESVLSDDMVPTEDRVVFMKTPNSLRGATRVQKIIRMIGATITAVPVVVCYLLHWGLLGRLRREEDPPEDDLESEAELI